MMRKCSILRAKPDVLHTGRTLPFSIRDLNGKILYARPAPEGGWTLVEVENVIAALPDGTQSMTSDFYIGPFWIGGMDDT